MVYDTRCVLKDVTLDIDDGEFVAITGPNGGGKTTLLRIILKLLHPTHGTVTYLREERPIKDLKIGYLPQKNLIDSHFPISVEEVIKSGLLGEKGIFSRYSTADHRKVEEIMEQMGVLQLRHQTLGSLSGGQMQRTLLGRALIRNPKVLVLDEPLSYVDKRFEHQIYNIISTIAPKTTILLVSHEMTSISPMATKHLIVDQTIHLCHSKKHYAHLSCSDNDN